jgi:rubrerythrin
MGELSSVEEILEYAITREVEANEFYLALADRVENPAMGELILEFAKEELEHKAKLELEVMKRGKVVAEDEDAVELKLTDYMVDVVDNPAMDYKDLLLLGMKKEKTSFRLYIDLAAIIQDEELRETLLSLAEEEARHKVQLEIDYDEVVLRKN